MNKDNAKDYLPLVQALADGKTLQFDFSGDGRWEDIAAINDFKNPSEFYRIKPKPRVFYINNADNVLKKLRAVPDVMAICLLIEG